MAFTLNQKIIIAKALHNDNFIECMKEDYENVHGTWPANLPGLEQLQKDFKRYENRKLIK
jgi:hypothetical protein